MSNSSFRRIVTILNKDIRCGLRDNLVTYLLLSPVVLGGLLAVILTLLESQQPLIAVGPGLEDAVIERLAETMTVQQFDDRAQLIERVNHRDDVLGLDRIPGEQGLEVVLQGNEGQAAAATEAALKVLASSESATSPIQAAVDLDYRGVCSALAGYCVVVVVGLLLGFIILEEKMSRTYLYFATSPLRFWEYLAAKLGMGLLLSWVMAYVVLYISLGDRSPDIQLSQLAVAVACGFPFAVSLGLIVGVQSSDQLGAVGVMKAGLPVWTSLPLAGLFMPEAWQWTLYPFACHWGFQAFMTAVSMGAPTWSSSILTLVTGLPVFGVTLWLLRRRLGFT